MYIYKYANKQKRSGRHTQLFPAATSWWTKGKGENWSGHLDLNQCLM